jgi:hypothetical protein
VSSVKYCEEERFRRRFITFFFFFHLFSSYSTTLQKIVTHFLDPLRSNPKYKGLLNEELRRKIFPGKKAKKKKKEKKKRKEKQKAKKGSTCHSFRSLGYAMYGAFGFLVTDQAADRVVGRRVSDWRFDSAGGHVFQAVSRVRVRV